MVPRPRWSKQETTDTDSAMAQVTSRRLLTASSGLISRQVHVGFAVGKFEMREFLSEYFRFLLPVSFHQRPMLAYLFTHSIIHHRRYIFLANGIVVTENPSKLTDIKAS
jgi:hypothetical protein